MRLEGSARRILTFALLYIALLLTLLSILSVYEYLSENIEVRYVATPSMEPSFPTGSIIVYVKDPVRCGYAIGDPVVYRHPLAPSQLLFHRVVDFADGYVYVVGDAAQAAEKIKAENVVGVFLFGVPYLGLLRNPIALAAAIITVILIFAFV